MPATESDVAAILGWCSTAHAVAIPTGGSSVVGGVEAPAAGDHAGVVSIDLGRLDRVIEIDRASRAARIQGGVLGPALEDQLRPHGLTLRHYPQSFEFSTLGGWIATRSGCHYATLYTHVTTSSKPSRDHARRRCDGGCQLGRRSEPGSLHRVRRNARRDRRGLDAAPGPADVPRLRVGLVRRLRRRRRRRARDRAGGALPGELPSPRSGRSAHLGRRQRRRGGSLGCIRVGRPSARRLDAAPLRYARHGGRVPERRTHGRDWRRAGAAPAPGAAPLDALPTT